VRREREVIRAVRAKTAITANTARKKERCVTFANDDFENARRVKYTDGRRSIVHADEKLSAFVELEREVLTVTFYLESIRACDQRQ
jgi:hypothetical protein